MTVPTIILCGGRGTRIAEFDPTIPKPLVPIGDRPIVWHIMKIYAAHGHGTFVLALGWLGDQIRRFFLHYDALTRDFTVDLGSPATIEYLTPQPEDGWKVTCLETGRDALTGTRVQRAAAGLDGQTFMVTYGDCVGDIDIAALLSHHRSSGCLATITAVQPPSRFGELLIDDSGLVREFAEKPQTTSGAINGGFMVFEREALAGYFPDEGDFMLEREPLSALAADGQLTAFEHHGFWQPMDTPRERALLEDLWCGGTAPWKVWA
ncbi:MAG: sugar phosphate nucleotidyltransferase [Acidimicrobiales bacterium]